MYLILYYGPAGRRRWCCELGRHFTHQSLHHLSGSGGSSLKGQPKSELGIFALLKQGRAGEQMRAGLTLNLMLVLLPPGLPRMIGKANFL